MGNREVLIGEAAALGSAFVIPFNSMLAVNAPSFSRSIHVNVIPTGGALVGKSTRTSKQESATLSLVHPNAGGIDAGARQHYVAVPQDRDSPCVRNFGCTTPELLAMAQWLKKCRVDTVAVEATGVYWVALARVLEEEEIEVKLVDPRQARALPGRKTDVKDCQWLQQLHAHGLLAAAFRPDAQMEPLRTLWRHRAALVIDASTAIQHMQKALTQMNLQLHTVLSDISGVSGMAMVRAILAGERDPEILLGHLRPNCKGTREQFLAALSAHYRDDLLFLLRQAVERYDFVHGQIARCDAALEAHLKTLPSKVERAAQAAPIHAKRRAKPRKNQPHFDLRGELIALTGVDLTQIEGIEALTAFTVISEQGHDMSRFPTAKHFASHLGLCPNHKITGGRIKSRKTRHVSRRAATALRVAAQSLRKSDSALGAFYRRIAIKHGVPKAITAAANKLAKLIYHLLKNGEDYIKTGQEEYERRHNEHQQKLLARLARKHGLELLDPQTGQIL
ncbi:MAG: IS110 family transposase [Phycisphaerales bacterium]|nr:IS110 family transposase [Phycisphaerales bacterium]